MYWKLCVMVVRVQNATRAVGVVYSHRQRRRWLRISAVVPVDAVGVVDVGVVDVLLPLISIISSIWIFRILWPICTLGLLLRPVYCRSMPQIVLLAAETDMFVLGVNISLSQVMLTTDQHYKESSVRPQVMWARQVPEDRMEHSMCCDDRCACNLETEYFDTAVYQEGTFEI